MIEKLEKQNPKSAKIRRDISQRKKGQFHVSSNSYDFSDSIKLISEQQSYTNKSRTTNINRSQEFSTQRANYFHKNRASTSLSSREHKKTPINSWNLQTESDKLPVKWIGVHFQNQGDTKINHSAFPKRKQKSYDTSLSNFLLKYGKYIKKYKKEQGQVQSIFRNSQQSDKVITNAATNKLKPRILWFDRKKPSVAQKRVSFINFK